ncbi:MAG TPA: ABC transporter ATP-binding protein [Candidatus Binataceae bacterium]|nr:ABC transporter ATP-binding protein [Candidatus Binataceae bacterium]
MKASDPVLAGTGLVAGYHGRKVLHEVSLQVAAGELLAVVGPNGAGKSTLLKVLSGNFDPWDGVVKLEGRPLHEYDRRAVARRLASLGQESVCAFAFTVMEMVLMGRAPHLGALRLESARDVRIAREALQRFDLLPLAARAINEISGGERRRVFLARVLAQEPQVALLDEPTAFLDLKHVVEIFSCLAQLRAERAMAVVATMHDLNAAALYADRVLLLKEGRTVGCGRAEEVLTRENLRLVYETDVYVGRNPATGAVAILPAAR